MGEVVDGVLGQQGEYGVDVFAVFPELYAIVSLAGVFLIGSAVA